MSKYYIKTPTEYITGLYDKLVHAKLVGDKLEANKQYTYMAEFTECVRRSNQYHLKRVAG